MDGTRARGRRGLVVATVGVGVLAAGAASAVGATRPPPDHHPRVERANPAGSSSHNGGQSGSATESGQQGAAQGSGPGGAQQGTGSTPGAAPGAADGQQPVATSNGS